jgi:superfamily II DNA or RNA helicase
LKDWKAINRTRPEDRRKIDRQTRIFLPLTDAVIEKHLLGKVTAGIYPLLPDETCWFLAVDFDKKTWHKDASAFLEVCRQLQVPAALERSRSGNGAHVWIFFEQPIPAVTARKLGSALLTRTLEERHELGLDSYDRLFPNQDTMPKGGFGNLIALPLQFAPRKLGNSVFIDADLVPYRDQWQYLAGLQRMPIAAALEIVAEAQRGGDLLAVRHDHSDIDEGRDPWIVQPSRKRRDSPMHGPLPCSLGIIRSNLLYVKKEGIPPALLNRLLRLAAFQNPEFYKAQAMRLSTYLKPRVIACGQDFSRHIGLPRGCMAEVLSLLEEHKIRPDLRDERFTGVPIEAEFAGQLQPLQAEAAAKMSQYDEGVLCAPTAFGKTAVAAWLIAERKVNTLVLVHRQQLLDQWRERLAMFLPLQAKSIGHIGGGKMGRTGIVDVAMIQSLQRKGEVSDLVAGYGQVIVDECHHVSAFTFEQVLKQVKAKFLAGLTATPTRKDGRHPIIYMQCGPIRFNMSARAMREITPFEHRVTPRYTEFCPTFELTDLTIQDVYAALAKDTVRNEMIADDIVRALSRGRCPLLLTGRTEHLQYFALRLQNTARHVFVLKGGMGKKQRQLNAQELTSLPPEESRVILATGSYIGEGFDHARLDTLFLAMPISWKGTLQQYVGRLHRLHHGKRVVQVYDYVDNLVPMLAKMYQRRLKGYAAFGYVTTPEDPSTHQDSLIDVKI